MKFQVDKYDEATLREKFNVTKQRLKSRIDSGFKDDKKSKMALNKNGKLSQNTFNAIQHVMSFISGNATFTQKDMMNELIGVLTNNKINFDDPCVRALSDKITICTLLLFHKSKFDIKGYKPGHCEIASEKESISHNVRFVDTDGKEVDHHESFGNLSIRGCVTLENDGKDVTIAHGVMSTDLNAEEWCSENLFHIEPFSEQIPDHMCKRIKLVVDLTIDDEFKLTDVTAPLKGNP